MKTWKSIRMLKDKKAQFFIFTAILLIAYSTLMLQSNKVIPEPSENFRDVYDNFVYESDKAVNNAVFEQEDIQEEYDRFLDNFKNYAEMKKLRMEIFALVAEGENIYYFNKMETPVTIKETEQIIPAQENTYYARNLTELTIEVPDDVFHENIYKFTLPESDTEVKAVLKVKKGDERELFVKE